MSTDRYDVIIIGTGAGGGTLARTLAPSGKRILILERGGFLPREQENWSSHAVFVENRYKAHEAWLDKDGNTFHPGIHYYVGGNTKVYGAALFRLRKEDFGELRHHGGVSPAWPIQYEQLAPYYLKAEQWYHVHGTRGEDPTEPPEAAPYPHGALPHEPRIQRLSDDLVSLGLKPFHLPIGVDLGDEAKVPTAPYVLGHFDGFPDPTESKGDSHVHGIKPAIAHANVTLKIHTYVEKLVVSPTGREVTEVHANDEQGKPVVYRGGIVVVACGAINSAALLLRSACDTHPRGLANRSDVVGRHYMFHHNSALLAIALEPNPSRFQKTLGINDYYFGSEDFEFPLGHIQMLGKTDADQLRSDAPSFAPGMALEQMAAHSVDFWLTSEDLPDPANRVTLEQNGTVRVHYTPSNTEGHERLTRKLKGLLSKIGFREGLFARSVYLGKKIPIAGTGHQCGTVRFGTDPTTSALDVNCRAHDVGNLYVVDGSCFVSSGAVNPALTIMANAIRVGEHILKQL